MKIVKIFTANTLFHYCVWFGVLVTMVMKTSLCGLLCSGITPCSPLKVNWWFGGTHSFHLQSWCLLHVSRWFLLGLFSDPECGGDMSLQDISWLSAGYTALYLRRLYSSISLLTIRSVFWLYPLFSLSFHHIRLSVINICFPFLHQFFTIFQHQIKVVRCMCESIRLDLK